MIHMTRGYIIIRLRCNIIQGLGHLKITFPLPVTTSRGKITIMLNHVAPWSDMISVHWYTALMHWYDILIWHILICWYTDILGILIHCTDTVYTVCWYTDVLVYRYTLDNRCVYGIRYTVYWYTVHVLYQHLHAVSRWFGSLCHQFETTVWTLMTTFPCVQVDEDNRRFSLPTLFETICITVSGTCGKVCLRNLITQELIV